MAEYVLGCDIGGTFTDFVLFDAETGETLVDKCLTTPADPSQGVITGIRRLKERLPALAQDASVVVHASTLTANAVLERKGARTALLCTRGFPNLLAARRHQRVSTYELFADAPAPLIPQRDVFEVAERTYSDGRILTELDEAQVRSLARQLGQRGDIESVAIAFLHSYANPRNEQGVERILLQEWPEATVTRSSHVLPEMREYERTSTTVINAYVKPMAQRYLTRLRDSLAREGIEAPLYIMLSNGGLGSVDTACDFPVRMTESGPVAGAIIGRRYAEIAGLDEALTFDMGGTTAKACLIRNGELPLTAELEVARSERFISGSGFPVAMPSVDLIEIGAGGGSIASVNSLGVVQERPSSAGAYPGPACYGLGGAAPTVTDADLALGYLNPDYFLGGEMKLDAGAAARGLEGLASKIGRDLIETAWTVHDVVNENMAAAVRMHVVEKGGDPGRAAVVALGGAGPVHAYSLARRVGASRVLIPAKAGVLSALGLLVTPPAFDAARTYRVPFERLDLDALREVFREMDDEVARLLRTVDPDEAITIDRAIDCKYIGQGYAVPVALGQDDPARLSMDELNDRFASVYRGKYGYFYDDVKAEVVSLRVSGAVAKRTVELRPAAAGQAVSGVASKGERPAYSGYLRRMVSHLVYDRRLLAPGARLEGPAIIEEPESTTIIDSGGSVEVDEYESLVISVAP